MNRGPIITIALALFVGVGCVDGTAITIGVEDPGTPDMAPEPDQSVDPPDLPPTSDMSPDVTLEPCDAIDCGDHGVCITGSASTATCLCDPGYRLEAGECVVIPSGTGTPRECDNTFGNCGLPGMSGSNNGGGSGSVLVDGSDLGETYQFADDYDNDGVEDGSDNCPGIPDATQADTDGDGVGDVCDNCLNEANADQSNINGDLLGDVCDPDLDGDMIPNAEDNCQMIPNPVDTESGLQLDADSDGIGDVCDEDLDGDGILNLEDACPYNADNTLTDDILCNPDPDGDQIPDVVDDCPLAFDPGQENMDGDEFGDACDTDVDGDDIQNHADNCERLANAQQIDLDRDGLGDACDAQFCFVVFGDSENCLDPSGDLQAYTFSRTVATGEKVPLRLFLNRQNQATRYFWRVVSAPATSQYLLQNAKGTVTISTPFEYRYLPDSVPTFIADLPGEYRIEVTAETVFEDRVSRRVGETTEFLTTFTANGEPVEVSMEAPIDGVAGGCSVSGRATNPSWLLLFGLWGGLRRRRRKKRSSRKP